MNVPVVAPLPQAKGLAPTRVRRITEAPENRVPERKPSQASPVQVTQATDKLAPVGRENLQIPSVFSARAMSSRKLLEAKTCVHVNAGVESKPSDK